MCPPKTDTFFETLKTSLNQVEVFDKFHVWTRLGELESQPTRVLSVSRHGHFQYAVPGCNIKKSNHIKKIYEKDRKLYHFKLFFCSFGINSCLKFVSKKYHMSLKRLFVRFMNNFIETIKTLPRSSLH